MFYVRSVSFLPPIHFVPNFKSSFSECDFPFIKLALPSSKDITFVFLSLSFYLKAFPPCLTCVIDFFVTYRDVVFSFRQGWSHVASFIAGFPSYDLFVTKAGSPDFFSKGASDPHLCLSSPAPLSPSLLWNVDLCRGSVPVSEISILLSFFHSPFANDPFPPSSAVFTIGVTGTILKSVFSPYKCVDYRQWWAFGLRERSPSLSPPSVVFFDFWMKSVSLQNYDTQTARVLPLSCLIEASSFFPS